MFDELVEINRRPLPFEVYTADALWANDYTSKQMLKYHLNDNIDAASRNIRFIKNSIHWISSYFKLNDKTKIADFGCGPGLYTTGLAEIGSEVTGIDFSKNSIEYARKVASEKGLNINYIHQNYLEFETTESFDLITMIMCDFCALSPIQRKKLLSKFYKFLKPDGRILLDAYTLNSFNQKAETAIYELDQLNGFWSPDDYYCFVNTFKYKAEKVILDKYTVIEKSSKQVIYNWLQYFSRESLLEELKENGFTVEKVYSDVAGTPFDLKSLEMAIVARKI